MYIESIFRLQQENKKGILLNIKEVAKDKEQFILMIQMGALKEDFLSLYIIALNRDSFDEDFVQDNDFRLNAIGEIVNIMSSDDEDTDFQNRIINYLMQVKDKGFLLYVLENLLVFKEYFSDKNLRVFIMTLCTTFKPQRLNKNERKDLKQIVYKHFLKVNTELQEALLNLLETLKVIDLYQTAVLINNTQGPIKKKLMEALKSDITFKMLIEVIEELSKTEEGADTDENMVVLLIALLDKYRLDELIQAGRSIKNKEGVCRYIGDIIREFMDEKLINEDRFSRFLKNN